MTDNQSWKRKELDKLFDFLEQNKLFSGVVLLAENGIPVYKRALGRRNYLEPQSLHTVFEIASISKSFTALAIMMLVEEKKLNLNDSLNEFFPLLPYENITIKHMLTHSSGLPDYIEWFDTPGKWDDSRIATNKDVIEYLQNEKPESLFKAGKKWEYCNTGYVLLAEIIEMVSKMDYEDYLRDKIFLPLEMHDTITSSRFKHRIENFAQGYIYDLERDMYKLPEEMKEHRYVYFLDGIKGDGGIKSTAEDLLKWERSIYDNHLITEETRKLMSSPVRINNERSIAYCPCLHQNFGGYGFGWKIENHSEYKDIILHDGYWGGYHSGLISYRDFNKAIIMLNNLDFTNESLNKIPYLLTLTIERILFGGKAELKKFQQLMVGLT